MSSNELLDQNPKRQADARPSVFTEKQRKTIMAYRRPTVLTGAKSHVKIVNKRGHPNFDFSYLKSVDHMPRQVQVVNLFDRDRMLEAQLGEAVKEGLIDKR